MKKNNKNSFLSITQRDYEIFYQKQDKDIIDVIINHIESKILLITEFFNARISKKTIITIFANRDYYKESLGILDYQAWMVGRCEGDNIYLLSPQNASPTHSFDEMLQVLTHEIVHLVQESKYSNTETSPFWIVEGIACYLANQFDRIEEYQKPYPGISDITNDDAPDYGGYTYAPIYVKYFLRTFGKEAFLKCIENNSLLQNFIDEKFEENAVARFLESCFI